MRASVALVALPLLAVLGGGYLHLSDREREHKEAFLRALGALRAIETEIIGSSAPIQRVSLVPAAAPRAARRPDQWRTDGQVDIIDAEGARRRQSFAAVLKTICASYAEARCWRVIALSLAGSMIIGERANLDVASADDTTPDAPSRAPPSTTATRRAANPKDSALVGDDPASQTGAMAAAPEAAAQAAPAGAAQPGDPEPVATPTVPDRTPAQSRRLPPPAVPQPVPDPFSFSTPWVMAWRPAADDADAVPEASSGSDGAHAEQTARENASEGSPPPDSAPAPRGAGPQQAIGDVTARQDRPAEDVSPVGVARAETSVAKRSMEAASPHTALRDRLAPSAGKRPPLPIPASKPAPAPPTPHGATGDDEADNARAAPAEAPSGAPAAQPERTLADIVAELAVNPAARDAVSRQRSDPAGQRTRPATTDGSAPAGIAWRPADEAAPARRRESDEAALGSRAAPGMASSGDPAVRPERTLADIVADFAERPGTRTAPAPRGATRDEALGFREIPTDMPIREPALQPEWPPAEDVADDVASRAARGAAAPLTAVAAGRNARPVPKPPVASALAALPHGAINTPGADGRTPLIAAIVKGEYATVRALLAQGADPNVGSREGATPLMYAAWNGDARSAGLLIGAGADSNRANLDGKTALMAAAATGNPHVVELLLARGAETDVQALRGWTALMYAVWRGHPEVIDVLLEHGADRRIRNDQGKTAGDLAVERNNPRASLRLRD